MSSSTAQLLSFLPRLRARTPHMVDDLAALVACESPADDLPAIAACAELVVDLGVDLFGLTPEGRDSEGHDSEGHDSEGPLLLWRGGGPTSVLLVGHLGTAWPVGTVARHPFSVDGDRASGPGVFDMKAGLVQMLYALSVLDDLTGVTLVVTPTRTPGSAESRAVLEREARGARAVLIGDPDESVPADGAAAGVFELARTLSRRIGLPELRAAVPGPDSPSTIPPVAGAPTLTGLGAIGGADGNDEWVSISAMSDRSALLAALIASLRTGGIVAADQGSAETSAVSTM